MPAKEEGYFAWFLPGRWPRWLVYVFAVVSVLAILLIRLALEETFGQRPLLILFVLPIILSAYLGGLGPGLVSTLVAAAAANYLLISPPYSFSFAKSADLPQWIMLIINGMLISGLNEAWHLSRRQVETARLLQAVTLASIGDAVITTDDQGSITFLNPEAERLTGWSQQEAEGLPLTAVFRLINEQTLQAEEDPVKKILASGKVLSLANHTLLLARDGREIAIEDSGAPIQTPEGAVLGVVLVFHDVSEQRQAEAALRESEERFQAFMDNSPAIAWAKDEAGKYTYLSKAYENRLGVRLEDWRGKTDFEIWPREIAEKFRANDLAALSSRQAIESMEETINRNGEYRSWWIFKFPFQDSSGKRYVGGIAVDITAHKQAEKALRASEEKFRLAMEAIQEGLWDWNIPTGELYISPGFLRSFGYDPEKVEHTYNYWEAAIHPEDLPAYQEIMQYHLAGNSPFFENEFRARIGDGQYRWFSSRGQVAARADDGTPLRMVGAVRDITEKKQAQDALSESLSLYQATLESTADGILAVNLEGRIVSWNRKFTDMWRLPENVIDSRDNDRVLTYVLDQLQDPEALLTRVLELYQNPDLETYDLILLKDGRVYERYSIPQYLNGHIVGRVLSFRDVSARLRAEAALKESESSYRRIVETANEGIWALDVEYNTTYVNQLMAEMLGYSREEMRGRPVTDFMFPEDLPDYQDKINRRYRGKFERRFRRRDGSELWTIVSVRALKGENGELQGSFAMLTDITDRKRAEEELKKSERRVKAKLDIILQPDGDIGQLDLEDIIDPEEIQSLMEYFYKLTHLPMGLLDLQGKVLVGVGWQDICTKFHRVHPETCRRCVESDTILSQDVSPGTFKLYKCKNNMWDMVTPVMIGGKHVGNLFMGQFLLADEELDYDFFRSQAREFGFDEESYLAALAKVPSLDRETVVLAMSFFTKLAHMISLLSLSNIRLARAVTEQERLVESLRLREEKSRADEQFLQDIFNSIKDGLSVLDLDMNIIRVNPAMGKYARIQPLLGRKCHEVFQQRYEVCQDWDCPVAHTLKTGEAAQAVAKGKATEAEDTYFVEIYSYPLINRSTGEVRGAIEYVRDITERQRAEEALSRSHQELQEIARQLEQSRNMLQLVLESIPVRVFWKNRELRYLGCNTLFARDAGLHHPQELLGQDDFAMGWTEQASLYRADDLEVMESGCPKMNIVEPQTTPTGEKIWLKTSKVPLPGSDGQVFGVLGIYEDITELKEKADQLRDSLREKEVMLMEIHHRVKNNMQMISTLFDLQLKYGEPQDPPTLFRDCQNRIRSMALVHESLYHTDTLASINFRQYLEKLVNRLLVSFGSSVQGIRATVVGAELHLDINQAVPAGLVASEIIVNCLKHAFSDQQTGEIQISLGMDDGHRVIEIKDNGVGLDREFSLENPTTFGWLMITNLMKQLEGTITVTSEGGTICRMIF